MPLVSARFAGGVGGVKPPQSFFKPSQLVHFFTPGGVEWTPPTLLVTYFGCRVGVGVDNNVQHRSGYYNYVNTQDARYNLLPLSNVGGRGVSECNIWGGQGGFNQKIFSACFARRTLPPSLFFTNRALPLVISPLLCE